MDHNNCIFVSTIVVLKSSQIEHVEGYKALYKCKVFVIIISNISTFLEKLSATDPCILRYKKGDTCFLVTAYLKMH